MFIFRHGSRPPAHQLGVKGLASVQTRSASRISIPFAPPPFPVIEACPAPTCQCRETPSGLEIEREQSLNGSMAAYAEQVLISTGRNDWKSRIEVEEEGVLVKRLKELLGPKGKYSDPFHIVMLTNCSFHPTPSPPHQQPEGHASASDWVPFRRKANENGPDPVPAPAPPASAFLLPSFQYIPTLPTDPASVEAFIKSFILPSQLHQQHDALTCAQKHVLLRQPERQRQFIGVRRVDEVLVLICGHGGRDIRCGTLGPILKKEFEEKLERQNVPVLKDPPAAEAEGYSPTARVGLISHIGGHKFAGNVIIYIPPSFSGNPLAGKGIWYGRVGPEHVEGIVAKTVLGGKVIKEIFRGGIDQSGEMLRL